MITFREDFGCWWPDYDIKPEACHKRVVSRVTDVDLAARMCRERRVCIQAGGHAGIWPIRLAGMFDRVLTFEPEPALFACLQKNVARSKVAHKIEARAQALGHNRGTVKLRPHCSAGSWRVDPDGTHPAEQVTIDGLGVDCDLLVLDVEGYETNVISGALETIQRCKPVIMVEELPRSQEAIRDLLDQIDYVHVRQIHADHIYKHGGR